MAEGYTLKEMVTEIRDENRTALQVQAAMMKSLENIDDHLEKLNSKVATHEAAIGTLREEHTKVKAFATAVSVVIGVVWSAVNFFFK